MNTRIDVAVVNSWHSNPFLVVVVSSLLAASCHQRTGSVTIPPDAEISANGIILSSGRSQILRADLAQLVETRNTVVSKPEIELTHTDSTIEGGIRYISVFIDRGYVFDGHYLAAWTQRMEGRQSNCLKLNRDARENFRKLLAKSRMQSDDGAN